MSIRPLTAAREPAADSCAHATVMQPNKYSALLLGFTLFDNIFVTSPSLVIFCS